jgi:hypothetical protein
MVLTKRAIVSLKKERREREGGGSEGRYILLLLSDTFVNKPFPTETIGIQQRNGVFYLVRAEML